MPWLNQFLLGRPRFEYKFDFNPDEMKPQFERAGSDMRNLAGDLKERVLRTFTPTTGIKSNWFPKTQLDQVQSLLTVTDTFLSFITRDDWHMVLEPDLAVTTTTVLIQNSSITKLSAAYVAAGGASQITVTGVFTTPNGVGTNYYLGGGHYSDATRTVTLGTALPAVAQVYISYTYTGWLVRLKRLNAPIYGGRVDLFSYDYTLEGV